jgi:hypothetical protein
LRSILNCFIFKWKILISHQNFTVYTLSLGECAVIQTFYNAIEVISNEPNK